jgi:hypothetical protein
MKENWEKRGGGGGPQRKRPRTKEEKIRRKKLREKELYIYSQSSGKKQCPVSDSLLKVVGNEKRGGSGSKLLIEYGFGPWRSMSVCLFSY